MRKSGAMHSQLRLILDQLPGRTAVRHGLQALLVIRYDVRPPLSGMVLSLQLPLVLSLVALPVTLLPSEITSPHMPPTLTNSSTMVMSLLQLSLESLASLVKLRFNQVGRRNFCSS